ncbi:PREDICTED: uncharacterized protein LOC105966291 [Erythranthe guttata]|uniref:uncharacterized protein LOC105966291 n=1 Tax=Erythranthe guttata TaxID=4155 RepID=UPI00064DCD34|nr:PREDICTED: uncharacterized protein LOC105966291 [Erythranthe guttata]|eukprot:XP_012846311.1 PREDICTED: uncharacterized protein LOC105966291 [Erythranthe guttata]
MARTRRKRTNHESSSTRLLDEQHLQQQQDTTMMESIRHSAHIRNENVGHPLESNSNDVDNSVLDQTENVRQKRARGPTYMTRVWARKGRKEVQFNEYGQAIGLNKSEYVEFVGTLVRNGKLLPIDIKDWHRVPKPTKSKLVELVKAKFHDAPGFEHNTLMNLAKSWRNWKNRVKANYFDPDLSLEENMRKRPDTEDERVLPDQWKNAVIYWSSDKSKMISAKNKVSRSNKSMHHTTGKRSFAQVRERMKESEASVDEDETGDNPIINGPSRTDLFLKCYTRNGESSNPSVVNCLRKMKDLISELPSGAKDIGPDDIFSRVVGQDKPGRVRMFGRGVTASVVYGDLHKGGETCHTNIAYKNEIDALKQRADEQDKLIIEQNMQIQELILMNRQRIEQYSSPQADRVRSISHHPSTSSSSQLPTSSSKEPLRVS